MRDIANGEYKFCTAHRLKLVGFFVLRELNLKSVVNFNCVTAGS